MKEKIAVLHASNTKNYGSLMMVTNLIYYINQINLNKYDFYVDNEEEDGINRIKKETGLSNVYRLSSIGINLCPKFNKSSKLDKLVKYIKHTFSIYKLYKKENILNILYLGGDDFSEDYNIKGLMMEFIKLYQFNSNKINTILIGQTIGPFYSWRQFVASMCFKNSIIYTRDDISLNYLINDLKLRNNNLFRMKDLALLELPNQKIIDKTKLLGDFNLVESQYIVLVPSGIWDNYAKDRDEYLSEWKRITIELLSKYNKKIVLLTHVDKDTEIINSLYDLIPSDLNQDVIKITIPLLPSEARIIIGGSSFIITGRMHASVSSIQTETPFVVLSYSIKYKGVIGELGLGNQIIEANYHKWSKNILSNEVLKKVEDLNINYENIKHKISIINLNLKNEIQKSINSIYNLLGK